MEEDYVEAGEHCVYPISINHPEKEYFDTDNDIWKQNRTPLSKVLWQVPKLSIQK